MRLLALTLLIVSALFSQSSANFPGGFSPVGAGQPVSPAGLTLTKTPSPTTYSMLGARITYTYNVKNTGGTNLSGTFTVNDNNQGAVPCGSGTLTPGNSFTCMATDLITQADLDNGSLTNTASATNGTITSPSVQATVTAIQSPSISLAKTPSTPTYQQQGQVITYTYTITNTGNVTLNGFTIADDKAGALPACGSGGLGPSITRQCTNIYAITANDMTVGTVTNHASATTVYHAMNVTANAAPVTITKASSIDVTDTNFNGGDNNVCNSSSHDDRIPIMTTLGYAASHNIPLVTMPGRTCWILSASGTTPVAVGQTHVSVGIWIPSNVTLQGVQGATTFNCTGTGNNPCTELGLVSEVTWNKMGCPGVMNMPCTKYYGIAPVTKGTNQFTFLSAPGNPFNVGDYAYVIIANPGNDDVSNGFISKITAISGTPNNPGTVTLADNFPRNYANNQGLGGTPTAGDITWGLTCSCDGMNGGAPVMNTNFTHDSGLINVIVNAPVAIYMNEIYNATVKNSTFNWTGCVVPQWNAVDHLVWDNNKLLPSGSCRGQSGAWEMTQRNSGFNSFTNSTFGQVSTGPASFGQSEFGYNMTLTGNTIVLNADNSAGASVCGFSFTAASATISNNTFNNNGGGWNSPGGGAWCDSNVPGGDFPQYFGLVMGPNNSFNCPGGPNPCILLNHTPDDQFSGNTLTGSGGIAIPFIGDAFQINNNNLQGSNGINVSPPDNNGWQINGNNTNGVGSITINNPTGGTCQAKNNSTGGHFSIANSAACAPNNTGNT